MPEQKPIDPLNPVQPEEAPKIGPGTPQPGGGPVNCEEPVEPAEEGDTE
jgi:hypothetical protein